jgi:hypothetical protein
MLNALVAATMLFSSILSPNGDWTPPTDPPPDEIVIDVVTVNGSGCKPGTAAVAVSPDNKAFTVTYSEYLAQVGVGAKPTDLRKNCQLALWVHVPQGFTYGIATADYRGYANLAKGATALERANYYFQGNSPTEYRTHPLSGPFDNNWQFTDKTEVGAIVYKPCGEDRFFNINTELRAGVGSSDPKTTTSFIMMDSTDGNISTVYHMSWKTCPK